MEKACEHLTAHGINLSAQRIAVMQYLREHHTHPTADVIHSALVRKLPTLSKTTVYNTLRLFVEHGAATMLTIDERSANFDYRTDPHAHFLCTQCGHIYDLPEDHERLLSCTNLKTGMKAESAALYLRGCCHRCNAQKTEA